MDLETWEHDRAQYSVQLLQTEASCFQNRLQGAQLYDEGIV